MMSTHERHVISPVLLVKLTSIPWLLKKVRKGASPGPELGVLHRHDRWVISIRS